MYSLLLCSSFFFNDTATTEIYTLSLHDALPIFGAMARVQLRKLEAILDQTRSLKAAFLDELAQAGKPRGFQLRSEEHTSELQSRRDLVCRLLLEKKKKKKNTIHVVESTIKSTTI